jgi:predicted kinase
MHGRLLWRPQLSIDHGQKMSRMGFLSPEGQGSRETTRLIVLRGNSASGKSSIAAEIRSRFGRGVAIVGQDYLRRTVLKERDHPGGANIGLIDLVARYALDHSMHTIIDGILYAAHYGDMLAALRDDHRGTSHFYYMDVPFEETLRRHATKPQADEYGRAEMSMWYRERDFLPGGFERVIPAETTLDSAVCLIMTEAGLVAADAQARHINDRDDVSEVSHRR